jgi:hypothetical protein
MKTLDELRRDFNVLKTSKIIRKKKTDAAKMILEHLGRIEVKEFSWARPVNVLDIRRFDMFVKEVEEYVRARKQSDKRGSQA